ncbi:MAG: DAK2 domain-containing protein [Chloroflexi bacterium]|nr:DAK2 domain-containing protein [Chloroflexota bacterium]
MAEWTWEPNPKRREALRRKPIDGQALKKLVEAGLTWLRTNQEVVNRLNVFPVPDGDTGTNMVLTMQAAYDEIASLGERHFGAMAGRVARGALMGARGNSGVILSQLWRGFAKAVSEQAVLTGEAMVEGLESARATAYRGVVEPVEGTILTVARAIADEARAAWDEGVQDPITLLERVVAAAHEAVERTPELLPVLKQAGVVDSGGKGLYFLLEGMLRLVDGKPLDQREVEVLPLAALNVSEAEELIEPGQDFEVVVDFIPNEDFDLRAFYQRLREMGTAIQVGEGDGMYRMHIHVPLDRRYEPIDYIMGLGTVTKVHMENLRAQMDEEPSAPGPSEERPRYEFANIEPGQIAVVAVAPGPGIGQIFASLGAAAIVEGGQTSNPSTNDFLQAIEPLPTDRIILLPNNKNILMAAEQVQELTVRDVRVVPSRTVPQGLAAMLAWDPNGDLDAVAEAMTEALEDVTSGAITIATRDVSLDGVEVRRGQYIGLLDGRLVLAADDLETATLELLARGGADEAEIITLFRGADLDKAQAHSIVDRIRERYPEAEVELHDGGQPHYFFIVSIE